MKRGLLEAGRGVCWGVRPRGGIPDNVSNVSIIDTSRWSGSGSTENGTGQSTTVGCKDNKYLIISESTCVYGYQTISLLSVSVPFLTRLTW